MKPKSIISAVLGLLILAMLVSCAKSAEFTSFDENYIFTPKDIESQDLSNFTAIKTRDGGDYFFSKGRDKNGFSALYGVNYLDPHDTKINFTSTLNIQTSEKRAEQLFQGFQKPLLYKVSYIDPKDYEVDEITLIEYPEYFSLVLRKAEIVYLIEIYGLPIKEAQIKSELLKKIQYIDENKSKF